jgi:hypothetical protein
VHSITSGVRMGNLLSKLSREVTLLTCIPEVPILNLGRDIILTCLPPFPKSVQSNTGISPQNKSRPLPFTSLQFIIISHSAILHYKIIA